MRLRSIIMAAAVAMTSAMTFTSCSKDDDKDKTIDPYGFWKMDIDESILKSHSDSAIYVRIEKDSICEYARPNAAVSASTTYSSDSVYTFMGEKGVIDALVANSDSVVIKFTAYDDSGCEVVHGDKIVIKRGKGDKYIFINENDTISATRENNVKYSERW